MSLLRTETIFWNECYYPLLKNISNDQAWWLTPAIPALWEAKVGGSRGLQIETILANMGKPCLY